MYALILAGGSGTRLDMGEKPLVTLKGMPMIEYVIDAFEAAGIEVFVVLTTKTPFTRNWCSARGIHHYLATGRDYIDDIGEAAKFLGLSGPFFTCVADLPCITPEIIKDIIGKYLDSKKEACSVWVPEDLVVNAGFRSPYVQSVTGIPACPAGINILRGDLIGRPQEELVLLLSEEALVYNINTREELELLRDRFSGISH